MLLHNFSSLIWSIQHAAELVKTVASRYDEYVSVKDLTDKINRSLTAAKKDNDFIYHDRVPEVKDLEQIGKAALVKPAAITPPLSQKFSGTNRGHTSILTWWNNLMKINKKIKVKMIKNLKLCWEWCSADLKTDLFFLFKTICLSRSFHFRLVWEDGSHGRAAVHEHLQPEEGRDC